MSRRGRRLVIFALLALILLFVANHAEHWHRQRRVKNREALVRSVSVRSEGDVFSGHKTIGIDETETDSDGPAFLRFAMLGQWEFESESPSPCPDVIRKLEGRDVACVGFMYPLEAGTKLKTFCLLRTTQTCCYGPRPQYNQYLLVEMGAPVTFERLRPVIVRGRFFPDPQPDQGFIYRMDGTSVTPLDDEQPDVDPAQAAKESELPLFDFSLLQRVKEDEDARLPRELTDLDGRKVIVSGFLLNRKEGPEPGLLVGRDWWDGVSQGSPPTVYSAVAVFPADPTQMPPVWKDKGVFRGVLRVEREPDRWGRAGIARLEESRWGTSERRSDGPLLKPQYEALALGALLAFALWDSFARRRNASRPELSCSAQKKEDLS